MHGQVIKLDHDFGSTFSGVLTDRDGSVRALWASYSEQVKSHAICIYKFWVAYQVMGPDMPSGNEIDL